MWAFESISFVALNTRMGLLSDNPDPNADRLAKHMRDFFNYSFQFDVQPSIWTFYKTAGFKKFLKTYDNITDITSNYIETAMRGFGKNDDGKTKCVLEQLLEHNKKVAVTMVMDMLMAGIDTVWLLIYLVRFNTKCLLLDFISLSDYPLSLGSQSIKARETASGATPYIAHHQGLVDGSKYQKHALSESLHQGGSAHHIYYAGKFSHNTQGSSAIGLSGATWHWSSDGCPGAVQRR